MIKKTLQKFVVIILLAVYLAACSKTGVPMNQLLSTSSPGERNALVPTTTVYEDQSIEAPVKNLSSSLFTLTSPEVIEGGDLPVEYTCDGDGATLPLAWSGAPVGTVSYAVVMHHVAGPTDIHWYWVLYGSFRWKISIFT